MKEYRRQLSRCKESGRKMQYELEISFESGLWTRLEIEGTNWDIFRDELENWEAVSYISIREKGATVWTALDRQELANS